MAKFIESANIKVFPAGFRKDALDTSKLTTEENLTSLTILSSDNTIGNRWITNPLNNKETIIYIKGYRFVFATEKIPENCNWAAIKLRDISITANNATDNGNTVQVKVNTKVLKPVESKDAKATNLDDNGGNFLGLGFYEEGDTALASITADCKVKKDSSLVLNSSEIKNGTSDTNIAEQFNTKKITVGSTIINENNINGLTLDGANEKISIKSISGGTSSLTVADGVNVDINAKVSVDNDKTTLGNITLTKDAAGNVKISDYFNLPKNTEPNKLLASNGETNSWISYSENNVADTIVKRSGNDIKTGTLNDVKIWLDETKAGKEPILSITHQFEPAEEKKSGLGIERPATLTVTKDGSIQTDINNDGTNVISIGAGTLIVPGENKKVVQIGNTTEGVNKVITLPLEGTAGGVLYDNGNNTAVWKPTANSVGSANKNKVVVFNGEGTIEGLAPTNHSTDNKTIAETYGLAAGGVYGHVKLQEGTLGSLDGEGHYRDENYVDGVAASIAHNHDGKYAKKLEKEIIAKNVGENATKTLKYGDSFKVPKFSVNKNGLINSTPEDITITLPAAYNRVDVKNVQGTKLYLTGAIANNFTPGDTTLNYNTGIYVGTDNNLYAPQLYLTSDKRLKENERPYKSDKSILDLPIYKYDYINGSKNQIGCMAQDLKEICPEIVEEDEKGYLHIQESKIVYLLIEEIKKLKEEIKNLKNN